MSKAVAIIPARLESSRLPNKALADILGLPMIVHVFKRCLLAKTLDEVYVATDNIKIKDAVESHGGKVIMTSVKHETGTDRIAEAAQNIKADIIVNVQGDEALVNPEYIDKVVNSLVNSSGADVAILVNPFGKKRSPSDIKVVLNENDEVMYLSRADIPSDARVDNTKMLKAYHIVPFRKDFLLKYARWKKTELEKIELNEYLRILEKGYKIQAVRVKSDAISVDTQQDLEFVRKKMVTDKISAQYL
jgi:3-deoxy-manno-octulosonate cytidylyltransferase (CMP-KDO synthetase)